MVSISRLKDATIDLGVAQIDRVRDIVSPQLARNFERLPIVLQGPMRELTSGRPVTEMTLDGIRTVSIGFLERIQAMLDHPSHSSCKDDGDDDSDDEVDRVSVNTTSFVSRWGFDDAIERFSRPSSVPRILPLHKLRTFAVQLTRSATLKVTVLCVQDTASAVMKRLRVQDARQLLDRVHLNIKGQAEEVAVRDRSPSAVTALASRALECLLGEWFVAALFGRSKAADEVTEHSTSQAREDLQLQLVEVNQDAITDSDNDEMGIEASAEPSIGADGHLRQIPEMTLSSTASLASSLEPMEFRLIVKNSFLEFEEQPATTGDMRRAHSWETIRSFGHTSSLNSEPFTLHARWEPPVPPSTSSNVQPAPPAAAESTPTSLEHPSTDTIAPEPSPMPPTSSSSSCGLAEPAGGVVAIPSEEDSEARTTVMLRNVPTGLTREELLRALDDGGFQGLYDFVYLPVDFTRNIGLGYALISLEQPQNAEGLLQYFDGFRQWGRPEHGEAPCEASWSEPRQGLQEHIERYRNSPVMHKSVPDAYKPVIFEKGVRVSFPAPTKAIRPPRIRHLKAP